MTNYQIAIEALSNMLDAKEDAMKSFSRHGYRPAFEAYYQRLVPAFDAIEELYGTVGDPHQMLENMGDALIAHASSIIDGCSSRSKKEAAMMNINMQMAVYVYPAILHYKGDSSKELLEIISVKYKEAFPKSNITPAEMEYIEKGFQRKFCYITTAVCESLGKGDDCYELNLLRDYRDTFLLTDPYGEEKVDEYYDVAPSIVKHIDAREDAQEIYLGIYQDYIAPCIGMIEAGENDRCKEHYIGMVDDLKSRYFLSEIPS